MTATPDLAPGPKMTAGITMLRRTGATQVQIRYSDDEQPVIWMAVAGYPGDRWETAASLDPERAVLRLCEQLIDGGQCTHCRRPAGFEPDALESMPADRAFCWYQWDPELAVFRRGCEGETPAGPNRAERRRRK